MKVKCVTDKNNQSRVSCQSGCHVYIRYAFDWKGNKGIEVALTEEGDPLFAYSVHTAVKDLEASYLEGEERVGSWNDKLFIIQPAMTCEEKQEVDDSLLDWASKL
jgi:hypothetical protein